MLTQEKEHLVITENVNGRVEVLVNGVKIAETTNAIRLSETDCPDRIYVPRKDIIGIKFVKFKDYECPHKGHAELCHMNMGKNHFENAAWSYTRPFENVAAIKDMVAFYQTDKVKFNIA